MQAKYANSIKGVLALTSLGVAINFHVPLIWGLYFSFVAMVFILWIDYSIIEKNLAWSIFFAVSMVSIGFSTLGDEKKFPKVCRGRRSILCDIENNLFSIGGVQAVATFYFMGAVLVFYWLRSYKNYKHKK
jgi:hypothetical protein